MTNANSMSIFEVMTSHFTTGLNRVRKLNSTPTNQLPVAYLVNRVSQNIIAQTFNVFLIQPVSEIPDTPSINGLSYLESSRALGIEKRTGIKSAPKEKGSVGKGSP
jgi:hypothetical protein